MASQNDRTAPPDAGFRALARDEPEAEAAGGGAGPARKPSIAEQVAERIMTMVRSGNLKPGDRLPTEAQMCVAFGISRSPLREALKALTIMGVLESRQGGRYTVTDLSPTRLLAPFSTMFAAKDYDAEAHFDARALVDLHLARLCARRATKAERQRIRRLAQDGHAFYADPVAFRLLDIEFHCAINEGARNPLIMALSQSLYDIGLELRRIASTLPDVIEVSVAQHCAVAEAICAGDAEAAAAAFRIHLEHVRDSTLRSISLSKQEPGHA